MIIQLRTMAGKGATFEQLDKCFSSALLFVDCIALMNTGLDPKVKAQVFAKYGGPNFSLWSEPWTGDYGEMRNKLLMMHANVEWLLMIDSDETFVCDRSRHDLDNLLFTDTQCQSVRISDESGLYGQPRFFRNPVKPHFSGITHEACNSKAFPFASVEWMRFLGESKSVEQYEAKARRDLELLKQSVSSRPQDDPCAREHFYMGESYRTLGDHEQAQLHYTLCAMHSTWPEEKAWNHFRAAVEASELGHWDEAAGICEEGADIFPTMPEIPWYAAYTHMQAGQYRKAVQWADKAIAINSHPKEARDLFVFKHAHNRGPFEVKEICEWHIEKLMNLGRKIADPNVQSSDDIFSLAERQQDAKDHEASAQSYAKASRLYKHPETKGWAAFASAIQWSEAGEWSLALVMSVEGIASCPGMPELAWYAGYCALHLGRAADAVYFASMAIGINNRGKDGPPAMDRKGRKHAPAHHEGPYDVLVDAYKRLGDVHRLSLASKTLDTLRLNHRQVEWGKFDGWHPEIEGWSSDILPFYHRMAAELPNDARIVEVGVWHGRSLLFLAERLQALGKNVMLTAVDLSLDIPRQHATELGLYESIQWVQGDSVAAAAKTADGRMNLVFIDALHDYDSVKTDILAWKNKVKMGGIMAGHDYMHQGEHAGVGRAVDEIFGQGNVTVEGTVWWVLRTAG